MVFGKPEALKNVKLGDRQRILMAMDLLSGCRADAVSSVQGTYNEATRRTFLWTHGRKFISSTRAKRLYRCGQADDRMNAFPESVAAATR